VKWNSTFDGTVESFDVPAYKSDVVAALECSSCELTVKVYSGSVLVVNSIRTDDSSLAASTGNSVSALCAAHDPSFPQCSPVQVVTVVVPASPSAAQQQWSTFIALLAVGLTVPFVVVGAAVAWFRCNAKRVKKMLVHVIPARIVRKTSPIYPIYSDYPHEFACELTSSSVAGLAELSA